MKKVEEMKYYLKDIEGYEIPSMVEEKDLFRRIKNNDKSAFDELVRRYSIEVIETSEEIFSYLKGAQIEDLIQEGYIGLVRAINIYATSESKIKFNLLARKEIRKSIIKAIKSNIELVSSITDKDFKKEVTGLLSKDESETLESRRKKEVVSLDSLLSNSDIEENGITSSKYLEDAVINSMVIDEFYQRIENSESLNADEKAILLEYFKIKDDFVDPLGEIASSLYIKREDIENIFKNGGKKLIEEINFEERALQTLKAMQSKQASKKTGDKFKILNVETEEVFFGKLELSRIKKTIALLEQKIKTLLSYKNIDPKIKEEAHKKFTEELEKQRKRDSVIEKRLVEIETAKKTRKKEVKQENSEESVKRRNRPDLDTLTPHNKPKRYLTYLSKPNRVLATKLEDALANEEKQLHVVTSCREVLERLRNGKELSEEFADEEEAKRRYEIALEELENRKSEVRRIRREVEISRLPKVCLKLYDIDDQIKALSSEKRRAKGEDLKNDIEKQIYDLRYQRFCVAMSLKHAGMLGYVERVYRMPKK